MLSLLDLGPEVLAYRGDGRIERDDIDRVFGELDRKLAKEGRINVYAEVRSLTGISASALWQDVKLGLQRLGDLPKIERAALVTDVEWLRRAAMVEDRVLRGVHVRTFPMAQEAEAREWVKA